MTHTSRFIRVFLLFMFLSSCVLAQSTREIAIPMTSEYWTATEGTVEFFEHRSAQAVKSAGDQGFRIIPKPDLNFSVGTIEFDVELVGSGFPGINFRVGPDALNSDLFYLRHFGKPDPLRRTSMQYAAVIDGVNLWDITDEYQAGGDIYENRWNHIKLVISEHQLEAYVNDMNTPALHVPVLEGITKTGGISLSGNVIYANMVLRPNQTEDLPNVAGYDAAKHDPKYLTNWEVTEPVNLPFGRDVMMGIPRNPGVAIDSNLLNAQTPWQSIEATHRAVINLTGRFGATDDGERRLIWLKTKVTSETAQEKLMRLGFQDEVWVFINGKPLHIDKNYYGSPGMKEPRGRLSLKNAAFSIPFEEGENEIVIGVANYFFAWGILARLDDNSGLKY